MVRNSQTKIVRQLLKFQRIATSLWRITPKWLSRSCLRCFRYGESAFSFGIRYLAVNRLAKSCGAKVIIFPGVYFKHIDKLCLGTNISIHEFCYIDAYGEIEIGDNVAIAHNCSILSSDHQVDDIQVCVKDAPAIAAKVTIASDVWIGCGVRILKGVSIGDGVVIGAGSVVTKDIESWTIAVGVPAKTVRNRS